MKQVTIYTDGACSGNPGPGGWGALLIYGEHRRELSGNEAQTTNQRMELQAAIGALQALKEPCTVDLYSDSAYLINAFQQHWLDKWKRLGWRRSTTDELANPDLWQELSRLATTHSINWHKVKGHSDNPGNNRCDELARQAIKLADLPH
jgi:ribonuclease HI